MPTTTNRAYPYPSSTAAPNVPSDMQALANAIDADVAGRLAPLVTVSATTSSAALGPADTVALTLPSATYKAGRAYRIDIGGGYTMSATTAYANWQVRKTNVSGTILIGNLRTPVSGHTSSVAMSFAPPVFIIGASDVTAVLVLTAAANAANTVVHDGTSTLPRHMTIMDIGPATNWSGRPTLS